MPRKPKKATKKEVALHRDLLEKMLLIRRFEERASMQYGLRKINGFLHLYIGQEAVAVGAISCLNLETDYVYTAYRDHGHALAMGMTPNECMAELYGKVTGCSKGKGGSMHFFSAEKHMMGGNGIVGAHIPLAAGTALKISYNDEDGVVLCFFGDGAIHQGSFHETLNMARVWNLPVIFICENNHYGMGTHYTRVSSVHDYSKMAVAYDIVGEQVDGMDVLEVRRVLRNAIERAKKEKIPSLIEAQTYRYVGHSISDPQKYRTKEQVQEYRLDDPITDLQKKMIDNGELTEDEFKALDKDTRKVVEDAVKSAEESPEPTLSEIYTDVLA